MQFCEYASSLVGSVRPVGADGPHLAIRFCCQVAQKVAKGQGPVPFRRINAIHLIAGNLLQHSLHRHRGAHHLPEQAAQQHCY